MTDDSPRGEQREAESNGDFKKAGREMSFRRLSKEDLYKLGGIALLFGVTGIWGGPWVWGVGAVLGGYHVLRKILPQRILKTPRVSESLALVATAGLIFFFPYRGQMLPEERIDAELLYKTQMAIAQGSDFASAKQEFFRPARWGWGDVTGERRVSLKLVDRDGSCFTVDVEVNGEESTRKFCARARNYKGARIIDLTP